MKTSKWIFAIMLAPLMWLACNDDDNDNADKKSLNSTDRVFVESAARSNLAEIQLGQLATTKATDSLVKNFAQRMVDEHTMAQNELQDIADDFSGVNWPTDMDQSQTSVKSQLDSTAAGLGFDTLYIGSQIRLHQNAVGTFQTATGTTTESRVKSYANKYLPKIQMHLDEADSLQQHLISSDTTSSAD
jgi:putative membrane protein